MGGEMILYYYNKPIEDISAYKLLLKVMEIDCKKTPIPVISNPITTWSKNEQISHKLKYYQDKLGNDDDYALSIDLGRSTRNPDNHYYIMFPKDPNKFQIMSNMHARGLIGNATEYDSKKWIHPWLVRLVVTFPEVFKLYYGDGYSGYDEHFINFCHYGDHVISEYSNEKQYLSPHSYSYVDPKNQDYLKLSK